MNNSFLNGEIIVEAKYYERINYNVSNQILSVVFDGRGDISNYAHDYGDFCVQEGVNIWVNGVQMDVCTTKTVKMIGRKQVIEIDLSQGTLFIEQFLDSKSDGVYFLYTLKTEDENFKVDLCMFWPLLEKITTNVFGDFRIIEEDERLIFNLNKTNNTVKFFTTTMSGLKTTFKPIFRRFDGFSEGGWYIDTTK